MTTPPSPPAESAEQEKQRRHERWSTLATAVASIIGTLITAAATVLVAVVAAPEKVAEITGVTTEVTRTVTVDAPVTVAETSSPVSRPTDSVSPAAASSEPIKVEDAIANRGCGEEGSVPEAWWDESVALAGSDQQRAAIVCRIQQSGAVVGHLDYTVPDTAKDFSATVGIDRQSPDTSARVEFSVVDLDGRVLKKQAVTYRSSATLRVPVSDVSRIRLQIALLRSDGKLSYTNYLRAAWITPAFL